MYIVRRGCINCHWSTILQYMHAENSLREKKEMEFILRINCGIWSQDVHCEESLVVYSMPPSFVKLTSLTFSLSLFRYFFHLNFCNDWARKLYYYNSSNLIYELTYSISGHVFKSSSLGTMLYLFNILCAWFITLCSVS